MYEKKCLSDNQDSLTLDSHKVSGTLKGAWSVSVPSSIKAIFGMRLKEESYNFMYEIMPMDPDFCVFLCI